MRLLWLALIGLWACGTAEVRHESIGVRVVNESFDTRRVRIYCDGIQVAVIHNPFLNHSTLKRVRVSHCRFAMYRIETITNAYSPPDPVLINPGDTLVITIRSYLPLTYHSVRKEGT